MKSIDGGVCAARGFTAGGVHCGVKAGSDPAKRDLALILSERECAAAAVYTTNRVKAAPIYVTMEHLEEGVCRGIIANSGNANACAPKSHENALEMCTMAATATGLEPQDFLVASTGVIGQTLDLAPIQAGLPGLVKSLSADAAGSDAAAQAIMTTDTVKKEAALEVEIGGKSVRLGAIAKGSGMIHPNMGTMLCFVTTDCAITSDMLQEALHTVVKQTFNRVTVDGDTSTNDMCAVLANGMADNPQIEWEDEDFAAFQAALLALCRTLARAIAGDGEGASRLITCVVHHARTEESAERLAKAVVSSALVKAAMFGADANWGRVLCAMGYSKAPFRPEYVDIAFSSAAGSVAVCEKGSGLAFDEEKAKAVLTQPEVVIDVCLNEGHDQAECWGCDLTYDYVKINGDYRT